jgi:PAS domain S-box-containing protein
MRLLIVDDHEVVRQGVRSLLSDHTNWDVCGEAVDGQDAVDKARELKPDLIVMDISMPRLNGLEATRQVRGILPDCEVLILSQHESSEMARQALKVGARGYVVKTSISRDLISAVAKASRREYFFDPAILDQTSTVHTDIQEILQRSAAFEQALRHSEQLYRSTFELAAVGVAHVSPEGKWLRVNKKLCEIVGYSEQELLGLTFQDVTHPDDVAAEVAETAKVRNGTLQTYSMEKRYIRKDGSVVWINLTVSGVRDSRGKLKHFISVVEDISARKSAERALRESEDRLRLAQQVANVGTFEWNIKTGVNCWTPELESMYGLPPGGFAGTQSAWEELIHNDDRKGVVHAVEQALEAKDGAFEAQWRVLWPDGSVHWLLGRAWVFRDEGGMPERFIGVNVDITERKQAEDQLKRSESRLRAAFSQSYSFLSLLEPDGTIIEINRAALETAGVSDGSQVVGRKLWEASWWASLPDEVEALKRTISEVAGGRSVHAECRFCLSDGTIRVGDRTLSPILDDHGRVLMIVAMGLDITERKQNETAIATAARQQKALSHLADELHRAGSLEDVYNAALNAILDALQCNRASILLCDDAGVMRFTSWRGLSNEYRAATEGHSAWRSDEKNPKPVCVTDIDTADFSESLKTVIKKEGIGALAFVPLVSEGKLTGKFMVYFNAPHQFAPDEIDLSLTIARQLSFAIQRCKNDENLRQSNKAAALLGAIVTSSDDAIVSKNLDGIIQSWNTGAERIFGYTAQEAIGQHITLIIPLDRRAEEDHILACLRRGERIDHFETVRRHKDGRLIDVSVTISPVRDSSGRIIGASKVARDITAQKDAAEKVRLAHETVRLMQVQDDERRRIARDFHDSAGQTLTVLGLSLAQLVRKAERVAPDLVQAGKEIEELVQQLHREIRTTSYLLHPPLLDEAGLCSALSCYVQGVAARSGMEIDLKISEALGRLSADMELAIFRMVQECLTNIHRHAESKTARIRIACDKGNVCVEVRDEGKGISPERLTEIESGGSGVGIAGIRERLRQFGGKIKIESDQTGTRVLATIPLAKFAPLAAIV